MTPGFENVSYDLFPLIDNHTLTLLYIHGSVETNNSIIRCAAVVAQNGDLQVVAYSDPVNFTVFCKHNCIIIAVNNIIIDYVLYTAHGYMDLVVFNGDNSDYSD